MLTEAGRRLSTVIAAPAGRGRTYRPRPEGTSPRFYEQDSGTPAWPAFVTPDGSPVPPGRLVARRTPDH